MLMWLPLNQNNNENDGDGIASFVKICVIVRKLNTRLPLALIEISLLRETL